MGHFRESIQRGCPQTPIDQQRVVVADKSEADDSNSLENPWTNECEPLGGVTFELWRDMWTLYKDRCYDDNHAYER